MAHWQSYSKNICIFHIGHIGSEVALWMDDHYLKTISKNMIGVFTETANFHFDLILLRWGTRSFRDLWDNFQAGYRTLSAELQRITCWDQHKYKYNRLGKLVPFTILSSFPPSPQKMAAKL